jgi:uncharacterized ferritin-like protein (DUF455 family)
VHPERADSTTNKTQVRADGVAFADLDTWAEHYVLACDLATKTAPTTPPRSFCPQPEPRRLAGPGRPPLLRAAERRERMPKPEGLKEARCRARLLHAFWHHELQAAELMCWAALAFADAETEFRKGLIGICLDEIRHMRLYQEQIEALGFALGDFGVRDWFWRHVPSCRSKVGFVALMGMGFEAANLEHAQNFAQWFRAAGDERAAAIQEQVGKEELAHVSFATRWFKRWTAGCEFETWQAHLEPPISPWVLHAEPIAEHARLRAGMPSEFIAKLAAYVPERTGRKQGRAGT